MLDRQKLATGLFANMGATSPQPEEVPSPMEFHSDALTADDLPNHPSRTTPLKALAAMGPMDGFLDSSPTPHARKSTQKIVSDDTSLATPTTIRNVQFAANDEPGSSPPRFVKDKNSKPTTTESDVVGSSFEYRQREDSPSLSFDDGTTIDEEALLDAVAKNDEPQLDSDIPTNTIMSELPSSTIDLQLTAQIAADIQATEPEPSDAAAPESNAEFVDAASHQPPSMREDDEAGGDSEVEVSKTPTRASTKSRSRKSSQADTSSTSRVGDSFNNLSPEKGTPNLRRSSRHSTGGSPAQPPSSKKRKQTPAKSDSKAKKTKETIQEQATPSQQPAATDDDDDMHDTIAVEPAKKTPQNPPSQSRKRKSTHNAEPNIVVPDTTGRKPGGIRRSQSLLSQVANSQDIVEEDTPAPKRARQNTSLDVSDAKKTTTTPGSASKTRTLSHVCVSPRKHAPTLLPPTPILAPTDPVPEQKTTGTETPTNSASSSSSFTARAILTPSSIISKLKRFKDMIWGGPQIVLRREEQRDIDDVLFEIRSGLLHRDGGGREDGGAE
jgi:hypothetical protein